ncbi:MAG: thermonuclease family protein [Terrimesophilobacter sp.]
MNSKSTALLVVVVLLIAAVVVLANLPHQSGWLGGLQNTPTQTDAATIVRPSNATRSHVAYVHDGDTLYLQPDGTSSRDDQIKVRLIGLDTPEVGEFEECFGTEARDYLRSVLPKGTEVWILPDREAYDQYGRALLYLWTTDDRSVNLDLVEKGYATALNIAPSNTYGKKFDAAEDAANKANAGLWGSC